MELSNEGRRQAQRLAERLTGEKIAAVSNKPQTTRHRIQGIITRPDGQIVLVDTPGVSTANLKTLPWRRVPRPIYPLDPES